MQNFDSKIPDSVLYMKSTFNQCTNLKSFNSSIPKNVIDMYATFSQCKNLKYLDIVIPETVTNMQYTFGNCLNLSGIIEINANLTGKMIDDNPDYFACFGFSTATKENAKIIVSGSCDMLQEIIDDAKSYSDSSNIIIED